MLEAKHLDNPPKCSFEDLLNILAIYDPEFNMKGKLVGFYIKSNKKILVNTVNNKYVYFNCIVKIDSNKVVLYLDDYTLEVNINELEDNTIRHILIELRDKYFDRIREEIKIFD